MEKESQGGVAQRMTWGGFWIGAACLWVAIFVIDYNRYVVPDAVGNSVGITLAAIGAGWGASIVAKKSFPEKVSTLSQPYIALIAACVIAVANVFVR